VASPPPPPGRPRPGGGGAAPPGGGGGGGKGQGNGEILVCLPPHLCGACMHVVVPMQVGAQVMLLKNLDLEGGPNNSKQLVNGSRGGRGGEGPALALPEHHPPPTTHSFPYLHTPLSTSPHAPSLTCSSTPRFPSKMEGVVVGMVPKKDALLKLEKEKKALGGDDVGKLTRMDSKASQKVGQMQRQIDMLKR
jgi:hypothetical protein